MISTEPTATPRLERRLSTLPRAAALGAIVVGVSVVAAWLLSPSLTNHQVPTLSGADVGKPFRGSSVAGFKAPRDVEVRDDAATTRRRDEARARVRPVFDHAPGVAGSIDAAVRSAFQHMRAALDGVPRPNADGQPRRGDDAAVARVMNDERAAFTALVGALDDDDFHALGQARFSAEAERDVLALVAQAYQPMVVSSRRELARLDAQGIVVRSIAGGETEVVPGPSAVVDVSEAAAALERSVALGAVGAERSTALRRAVLHLAQRQLRANLTINIAETEARRTAAVAATKPVSISVKRGQRVVGDGELVTEAHVMVSQGLRAQLSDRDVLEAQLGSAGMVAVLVAAIWIFFHAALRRFRPLRRDALFLGLWGVALLAGLQGWVVLADRWGEQLPGIPAEAWHFAFPLVAGVMLVRFVVSAETSLYFGLVFSVLAGALLGNAFVFTVVGVLTSLVAAERMGQVTSRLGVVRAGAVAGTFGGFMLVLVSLATGRGVSDEALASAAAVVLSSTVLAPVVVLLVAPLVELAFGYVSNVKLLQLANLNHPALKELVLHAPGSYQHSLIVGALAEGAAQSVGANALLAKAGAYYHDLGKVQNPAFFGENQKTENPHDGMSPTASAQFIRRHVADGVARARTFGLPRRVIDIIEQHHGTRRLDAFWSKARRLDDGTANDEATFRYPGPKPRTVEAALVMVADAVEAASRGVEVPTFEALHAVAKGVVQQLVLEGQFDECDVTVRDLSALAESLAHTLEALGRAHAPQARVIQLVKASS